jgi:long-chain fatty acid transport protein
LRFGYSHTDQPIDSDQVLFNILAPGVIEDHVTIGATIDTQIGEINLEAMHALHHSVKGANPFDPTQEIRLKMNQFEIGASWSKEF